MIDHMYFNRERWVSMPAKAVLPKGYDITRFTPNAVRGRVTVANDYAMTVVGQTAKVYIVLGLVPIDTSQAPGQDWTGTPTENNPWVLPKSVFKEVIWGIKPPLNALISRICAILRKKVIA